MMKMNCCALVHVFDNQSCDDCTYFILCTNTKLGSQTIFLEELYKFSKMHRRVHEMSFISYSDCMNKILCTYS